MVYGQHTGLGEYLLDRVRNRKTDSRSTQNVAIETLIKKLNFSIVTPPDKTKEFVSALIVSYQRSLAEYATVKKIKTIQSI